VNNDRSMGITRAAETLLLSSVFVLVLVSAAFAQTGLDDIAPPPVQVVHKEDLEKLNAEQETKSRVQLSIGLMSSRLNEAEQAYGKTDYDDMFVAFGQFQGLLNYSLDFLSKADNSKGKALDNFRKFELALKGFQTRLELIHRELPLRWEEYTRKLIKSVRDGRAKALEPMFGSTVLPDRPNKPEYK